MVVGWMELNKDITGGTVMDYERNNGKTNWRWIVSKMLHKYKSLFELCEDTVNDVVYDDDFVEAEDALFELWYEEMGFTEDDYEYAVKCGNGENWYCEQYREKRNGTFFYGKDCNYAFPFDDENDFEVAVFQTEEDFNGEYPYNSSNHFNNVDSCIGWAAWYIDQNNVKDFYDIQIYGSGKYDDYVIHYKDYDAILKDLWHTLSDINVNDQERTEQNWFIFPAGTYVEDIWHWFDERYSEGVGKLMEGCD